MASSSSSIQHKRDVFLSFRGEDTRYNFTSHLHAALKRKAVVAFIDDELRRGEQISPALEKAIEESKISIIIFSKNYASSSWCLNELCKILEWQNTHGQIVVPIFYLVDPSDVKKQKGSFAEAFAEHEKQKGTDKVQSWRDALEEIGTLSGWHFKNDRSEYEFIEEIVEDISEKLKSINRSSNDYEGLVGLNSRIEQIESLLRINELRVRIVGIWGMGGIGKTTLAEAVFYKNSDNFDACCFLPNVREELEKPGGEVHLWQELVSTILNDRNLRIGTLSLPESIRRRLSCKRVLIGLDDVNDYRKFDVLRKKNYFGRGSRIIVTSRDKQVFQQVVDKDDIGIYEVKELTDDEALQLFSLNARPMEDCMELSMKVIDYAQGVPLALKVLGSALCGKSKREWESELKKLKQTVNPEIHNLLRFSYDGLDDEVKDIFLDIACFFKGEDRDFVEEKLGGCYISLPSGISVLRDKSLVTMSGNKLLMHDLIQEMGWNIVREESIKEPGKRSRLWSPDDVYHVLRNNKGTEKVEGIFLDMSKIRELRLTSPTFGSMYNLRLLKLYYSDSKRDTKLYISQEALEGNYDKLCYFRWDEYPLRSLPSTFCAENLVELNMTHSHVERLWNGNQKLKLVNLKSLNLSYSQHLIEFPDLSHSTNLRSLTLDGCKSLVEVPSYIGHLNELRHLSLSGCENLRNLPNISHLRSLGLLNLSGCSNITKFPEVPRELSDLSELFLSDSAIEEVPLSVGCLPILQILCLDNCKHLERLPSSFCKLKSLVDLDLSGCSKLNSFPEILETMKGLDYLNLGESGIEELPSSFENLINLRVLHLQNCKNLKNLPSNLKYLRELNLSGNNFESIPPSIKQLSVLRQLCLSDSKRLQSIPDLPSSLRLLVACHCTALEIVSLTDCIKDWVFDFDKCNAEIVFTNCVKLDQLAMGSIVKEAPLICQQITNVLVEKYIYREEPAPEQFQPSFKICYPGSEIPEWFACQSAGSTISTQMHQSWHDCKFVGCTFAVVVSFEVNNITSFYIDCQSSYDPFYCFLYSTQHESKIRFADSDHVFLGYKFIFNFDHYKIHTDGYERFPSDNISFDFKVFNYGDWDQNPVDKFKVKKCGVHLWYFPTETGSGSSDLLYAQDRECNPNHDPTQLSLKCSVINQPFGEEDGAVAKRCRDEATPSKNPSSNEEEEEEEEEEPFPKRFK